MVEFWCERVQEDGGQGRVWPVQCALVAETHERDEGRVFVQDAELWGRVEVIVYATRPPALPGGDGLLE